MKHKLLNQIKTTKLKRLIKPILVH